MLIVQKYGGTSVGSIERMQNVAKRCLEAQKKGHKVAVVVSAMSGETNRLLKLVDQIHDDHNDREVDVIVSTGEQVSVGLVALAIRKLGHRYVQTATALLACSIAFSLLQLPVAMIAGPVPESAAELGSAQIVLGWFTLGLFFWQIAVNAHVVRHAMDSSFGFALGLVATWVLAFWALDHALFAVPK